MDSIGGGGKKKKDNSLIHNGKFLHFTPVVSAAHIHMPPNSVRSELSCFLTLNLIHVIKQKCPLGVLAGWFSAGWAETMVIF